ncbi:MAG TPA: mucoidy inhibitor MuiA family protein, partial [Bacteroidetes bacterium]|nr:mucoidy inhibitor MuiA family protein [Bacteroidota bacterium]
MKNIFIILSLLLLQFVAFAQTEEHKVPSDISEVTVFLHGAQVTRTASVSLEKGKNVLIFRGLASGISPRSIQVSAPENVLINSVKHEINYLQKDRESPRLTEISDSILILDNLISNQNGQKMVMQTEKTMVLANQKLGSEKTGTTMAELQKAANFFRSRLTDIEEQLMKIQKRKKKYKLSKSRLSRQYKELNGQRNRPSNDIRVILNTFSRERVKVSLRYIVNNAGWTPGYDLRAKDTQSPIQLDYRAAVYQNTGLDWEDVKLTLSSGNPNQGGTQPILGAWNLYVQQPHVYYKKSKQRATMAAPKAAPAVEKSYDAEEESSVESDEVSFDDNVTLADYTEVNEGATTAEFAISILQTIASGEKPQQVSIQSNKLPATYQHFAVPKLDHDAFLLARITEWEGLNLLPGEVQIFFEGTYVAQSYIDPNFTKDTLDFSLGRDKKIVIERKRLQDFSKIKTIGFNREKTFAYEIKVRNTKAESANLRLEDQIPVSQDKSISV